MSEATTPESNTDRLKPTVSGRLHKFVKPLFVWRGDLNDDCTLEWGDYYAHVENMGESWYCSVSLKSDLSDTIFHTCSDDILPLTGKAARWLCEMVIKAQLSG